jgi:hypothetical protein
MEVNVDIKFGQNSEVDCIMVKVRGQPDMDEFKSAISVLSLDPRFNTGSSLLCDFSEANLDHISDLQFISIRTFGFSQLKGKVPGKVALVGGRLKSQGTRHYLKRCLVTENVRAFFQSSDAMEWLEETEEVGAVLETESMTEQVAGL